eukprot:51686_1
MNTISPASLLLIATQSTLWLHAHASTTTRASWRDYTTTTGAEETVDFPWLFFVLIAAVIVALCVVNRCKKKKAIKEEDSDVEHVLKPLEERKEVKKPLEEHKKPSQQQCKKIEKDTVHDEGIHLQSNTKNEHVTVDNNAAKLEVSSPPEAFAFKSNPSPPQEELNIGNNKEPVLEGAIVIKNNTEEKAEQTQDENANNEDTMSTGFAIGNMISLVNVLSPSEMTPETTGPLSYPTPQAAKSIDIISSSENVEDASV